jgi:glucosylceramidase
MEGELWNRRQAMKSCARVAACTMLARPPWGSTAAAQMPPPEPVQDDRLTFVTTTEASAWQKTAIFKPRFGIELPNLNVDPAQT